MSIRKLLDSVTIWKHSGKLLDSVKEWKHSEFAGSAPEGQDFHVQDLGMQESALQLTFGDLEHLHPQNCKQLLYVKIE
jgi:hypothetical protein